MTTPIHGAEPRARAAFTRAGAAIVAVALSIPPQPAGAAPDLFAMGKPLFDKACGRCHEVGIGAANGVGPDLNGIIGSPAGLVPGYEYSTADTRSAVIWTRQAFGAFIENPQADMPGTRMAGPGVPSQADRDAIFAYVAGFNADGSLK